jgi:hypothetical protein
MIRWYRLDGHTPVPCLTDVERIADWDRREQSIRRGEDSYRVARTAIADNVYVSTVFLGLDHQWMLDGPPLLFETMVFIDRDSEPDWAPSTERCSTWEQAVAQHDQVVADTRRRLAELLDHE